MIGTHSASGSEDPPRPPRADPDADILPALKRGDPAALRVLMDRHMDKIKSTAWHMLGDEMAAEDIAQEVFLRAWKTVPNWQTGKAKFSTWLFRVCKNLCYDRLRKKTEIFSDTPPDIIDEGMDADEKLQKSEVSAARTHRVQIALAALPKRQRLAVTLCHYQDLSQGEASEVLGISVRAYESLLARARKNLRRHLQNHKTELLES